MTHTAEFTLATYPNQLWDQVFENPVDEGFVKVRRIAYGNQADIIFQKFTLNYNRLNSRPFMLSGSRRQFKTLHSAVRALILEQHAEWDALVSASRTAQERARCNSQKSS